MSLAKIVVRQNVMAVRVTQSGGVQTVKVSNVGPTAVRVSSMGRQGPRGTNHPVQLILSCIGRWSSSPNNVFATYTAPEDMTLLESESRGGADVAATSTYVLSLIRSDNTVVATVTWSAGQTVPVIAVLFPTILEGQRFRWVGSTSSDDTLSNSDVTLVARRIEI